MSEILVRLQEKNDLEQIVDVFIESFLKSKPDEIARSEIIQRFQLINKKNITSFYVAELMEQIVGIGGLTNHKGSSFIGYIGVNPNYRKRGIGTKIFEELVKEANKNNQTQELFSNPGADTIYRRFGYKDDFIAHIYELTKAKEAKMSDEIVVYEKIPNWIFNLDKKAMGFDRTKFLNYLINLPRSKVYGFEKDGFAFDTKLMFGPIIAISENIAFKLIDYNLISGNKKIIASENIGNKLLRYSPEIKQTCFKMSLGKPLENKPDWLWSYNSFASS
ncbi:MAG TPA: GNAT family N-acetyltransferase [Candidatus Bathyarchaeia archaeon]|nr:GNAT family N-acetyltransferase [Candidatus Bathyarchaeia archaeon]